MKSLIFDWGDTLMADYPQYKGSMVYWDHVQAMPGVTETMPQLYNRYACIVASNAGDSDAELMRQAFSRVLLDQYFHGFITSKELGYTKPAPEFFHGIIEKYKLDLKATVMIGNDYNKDIVGAKNIGLQTVLITTDRGEYPDADYIITSFAELLKIL